MVYRLWYDEDDHQYKHVELDTYGLDSNLILEEAMMVNSRDAAVEEQIKKIQALVGQRELDRAKALLADLETKTSPLQPSLIKIRSVINRMESNRR